MLKTYKILFINQHGEDEILATAFDLATAKQLESQYRSLGYNNCFIEAYDNVIEYSQYPS